MALVRLNAMKHQKKEEEEEETLGVLHLKRPAEDCGSDDESFDGDKVDEAKTERVVSSVQQGASTRGLQIMAPPSCPNMVEASFHKPTCDAA